MPASISTPSWREDAPSAEETQLASLIGSHNPMAAANLMIPEMQRNFQAQDAYHQQMLDNNLLQRQNIAQAAQEAKMKGITSLLEHVQPGTLAAARSVLGDMVPDAASSSALELSAQQKADAANAANLGKGNEGGVVPSASAVPAGFSVTSPGLVQAAGINAAGRVQAAGIGAAGANKSYTESIVTPDPTRPWETFKTHTAGGGGGRGAPAGLSGVVPPSNNSYEGQPNPFLGGATSPPTTNVPPALQGSATPGPTPAAIATKMQTLAATNPNGHTQVTKAAAANGGQPIPGPRRADGSGTLMGADGQAY